MAPSKSHLAFFLAIALVAVMPQPSTTVRIEPPTSSTTGKQPSKWHISDLWRAFPSCFPFPIFSPPTPSAPVPPTPSKPHPIECLPSLMGLMPCKDFMIDKTVSAPPNPGMCCDGLKSLLNNATICMCHFDNGNLEKLIFQAPINGQHFLDIFNICQADIMKLIENDGCKGYVPPISATPTPIAPVPPTPSKPQPEECVPSLIGLMPCKDFITNKTAPAPPNPGKCCDGLNSIYKNASVCMCNFDNLEKLMSAPIDSGNFIDLLGICHTDLSEVDSCEGPVQPMRAAPTPEAAP